MIIEVTVSETRPVSVKQLQKFRPILRNLYLGLKLNLRSICDVFTARRYLSADIFISNS